MVAPPWLSLLELDSGIATQDEMKKQYNPVSKVTRLLTVEMGALWEDKADIKAERFCIKQSTHVQSVHFKTQPKLHSPLMLHVRDGIGYPIDIWLKTSVVGGTRTRPSFVQCNTSRFSLLFWLSKMSLILSNVFCLSIILWGHLKGHVQDNTPIASRNWKQTLKMLFQILITTLFVK
jgi:hypothetical protein